MSDILDRLREYNPPDRTIDSQRQIAVDIHEAAARIEALEAALAAKPHPLTDEQIAALAGTTPSVLEYGLHAIARAVERAHGIGDKP